MTIYRVHVTAGLLEHVGVVTLMWISQEVAGEIGKGQTLVCLWLQ